MVENEPGRVHGLGHVLGAGSDESRGFRLQVPSGRRLFLRRVGADERGGFLGAVPVDGNRYGGNRLGVGFLGMVAVALMVSVPVGDGGVERGVNGFLFGQSLAGILVMLGVKLRFVWEIGRGAVPVVMPVLVAGRGGGALAFSSGGRWGSQHLAGIRENILELNVVYHKFASWRGLLNHSVAMWRLSGAGLSPSARSLVNAPRRGANLRGFVRH